MERRKPQAGDYYKHFKDRKYKIIALAKHSETMEEMVVYEALYGDGGIYVRPLEMFMSEVDHNKYPEVSQIYRFERIEENHVPLIIQFLDLEENQQKVEFLQAHRDELDSAFLSAAAESLDYTERDGDISERYQSILYMLRTRMKYESTRLR